VTISASETASYAWSTASTAAGGSINQMKRTLAKLKGACFVDAASLGAGLA